MTREETIALWQECEDARTARLENGKSEDEAHEAAKTIWNAWAAELIKERKLLEVDDLFKTSKFNYETEGYVAPETCGSNEATTVWLERASGSNLTFGARA